MYVCMCACVHTCVYSETVIYSDENCCNKSNTRARLVNVKTFLFLVDSIRASAMGDHSVGDIICK